MITNIIIFGGGGYLDYWVPNTSTGTTFDFKDNFLSKIKRPVLFSSLGCYSHGDVPEGNTNKLLDFFAEVDSNKYINIFFRNDGSIKNLNNAGFDMSKYKFDEIVDHAFFLTQSVHKINIKPYVAINIANDQMHMNRSMPKSADIDSFNVQVADLVLDIATNYKLNVQLVPHIYSDYFDIIEIIKLLPDYILRNNVVIGSLEQNINGLNITKSIYSNAKFVIATRFHANVISMCFDVGLMGISVLDRISELYKKYQMDRSFVLPTDNLKEKFKELIGEGLNYDSAALKKDKDKTIGLYRDYFKTV